MISGTVTDQVTGLPLANMNVAFEADGFGQMVCTDANGYSRSSIFLRLCPSASMPATAATPAAARLLTHSSGGRILPLTSDATVITLTSGDLERTNIHFTGPAGAISGTVRQEDGNTPMPNMEVWCCTPALATNTCGGSTHVPNSSGNYTPHNLPRNIPVKVSAGINNWCSGVTTICRNFGRRHSDWANAAVLTLTDAAPNQPNIDFTLELGGTISGHVYQSDGVTPVGAIASVDVTRYSDDSWVGSAPTDASGLFTIAGLTAGVYRVRGNAPGYAFEFYSNAVTREASQPVTVGASGTIIGIDFTLDQEGTVSGHITEEGGTTPLANVGVNVQLGGSGYDVAVSACTDVNGDYTLYNVPLNVPLKITASRDGWNWCASVPKVHIQEWWQNTPDFSAATPITLTLADPSETGVNFTLAVGGSITGHLYESDGATPITANASIDVEPLFNGAGVGIGVNSDGSYTIGGLAPGDYRVRANGNNYAWEYYDDAGQNGANADTVTVAAGATVPNIDFALGPGGSISGTVTAGDGVTPLANMRVDIDDHWVGTCTDANGHFTMSGLPLDTPLRVNAGGIDNWCGGSSDYVYEYWQDAPDSQTATPVILTMANRDRTGIDFALVLGGAITGHFYESDGTTLITSNAWVNVEPLFDGQAPGAGVEADGSYIIRAIPPGDYRVRAQGDGYAFEFYDEAGQNGSNAMTVTVVAGATVPNIDFTLDPGGSISGTVTAADGTTPLANMRVDIDNHWVGTCTDVDGHYTMPSLPLNQPLRVNAGGNDNWCGGSAEYVYEYWQDAPNSQAATPVILTLAERDRTDIHFSLVIGGTITGHLYESDGTTPITSNAWVNVEPLFDGQAPGAGVQPDGSYAIHGLATGDYRVRAQGDGYAFEFYNDAGQNGDNATIVTVVAGATVSGIDFALEPGGSISGKVTAADGTTPLANMRVDIDGVWAGTCTDANGHYTLSSLPLNQPLKVFAGGNDNWCGGSASYVFEYWQDVPNSQAATPIVLTLTENHRTDIDFALALGGSISGTVRAAEDNVPLADIWICAFPYSVTSFADTPPWSCGQTQANGTYLLSAIAAGNHRIWLFPEDRLRLFYSNSPTFAGATPVAVTAGSTTPGIDFSLPLAAIISGTVTDANGQPMNGVTVSLADGTYPECSQSDGTYRIWVPAGQHVVNAGAGMCNSEIDFPTQYYQWVTAEGDATPVNAVVGQTTPDIDFTLQVRLLGEVVLQGHGAPPDPRWVQDLSVSVTPPEPAPSIPFNVTTDENGAFSLNGLEIGPQRIWIKGAHTLANAADVVLHYGDNLVQLGLLREGDANDSNGVTIADFSLLAASFSKAVGDAGYDARADFNDDDVVNISDFSLLASNFTQSGAEP
ncbi:MAG: carboxypeptidase regulatory-like domain-containing protein [Chloroflexi bacterium]|nr:carboxypeptidase regulatory-like domain-containing protein [Chloroflexota bacterium]